MKKTTGAIFIVAVIIVSGLIGILLSTVINQKHTIADLEFDKSYGRTIIERLQEQIEQLGEQPTVTIPPEDTTDTSVVEGPPGPKGEDGAQGPKGDTGASGTPGLPGSNGGPGADGSQGPAGAAGATGASGADGKDGVPGPQGETGPQGEPGKDGADGAPGRDGVDGAPGKDGQGVNSLTFVGILGNQRWTCANDGAGNWTCSRQT